MIYTAPWQLLQCSVSTEIDRELKFCTLSLFIFFSQLPNRFENFDLIIDK